MHKAVFVLGLAACTGHERSVDVTAMRGDEPEPGAIVIAHHANGERIADVHVDASGHAAVRVDDGDLVTLLYPPDAGGARLFTVVPTGDIVVHGPMSRTASPPLGTFNVEQPANINADRYYVQLACGWTWVTTWPQSFDIGTSCGFDPMDGNGNREMTDPLLESLALNPPAATETNALTHPLEGPPLKPLRIR